MKKSIFATPWFIHAVKNILCHYIALQCTILHCSAMIKWRQTAQAERTQTTTWSRGRLNLHQSILVWFGLVSLVLLHPHQTVLVWFRFLASTNSLVQFFFVWSGLIWISCIHASQYWFGRPGPGPANIGLFGSLASTQNICSSQYWFDLVRHKQFLIGLRGRQACLSISKQADLRL